MVDAPLPPEIAKYLAILGRDPNSMIFAPLAEAYRRAGMLDEAIATAKEGLERHPNYLSAMVALGRAYFEKGMLKEASEELEHVVKIAPDNIIAKSILEEIRKQGPVVSGQGPEGSDQAPGVSGQVPEKLEPETWNLEPEEELEPLEVEDIAEVEEVEAEPVFGEEITEELWTGESIPEKKAEPKKGITTETIAELYIKQGYLDKAIDIYQTLYDADPYNDEIKGKLEELKGRLEVRSQGPETKNQEPVVSIQVPGKLEAGTWKLESEEESEIQKPETEDENVKRLEAWLKSIQNERRKG